MKKLEIAFIALLLCLGGRPPVVRAQEQRPDIDESIAQTAADVKEEAVLSEVDDCNDDSSLEETVNTHGEGEVCQNNLEDGAEVTITIIGEGEVEQKYYV